MKKGAMKKGSKEVKVWSEKMRRARMAKKQGGSMESLGGGSIKPLGGGNIWKDIGACLNPLSQVPKNQAKMLQKTL